MPIPSVLTKHECAARYKVLDRKGEPSTEAWMRLVRSGHMPPPIDDELDSSLWRWSIAVLDAFDMLGRAEFFRRYHAGTLFRNPYRSVAVEADATPAFGIVRPELRSVTS